MKYLIFTILLLTPLFTGAVAGEQVRFDFTNGQPAITDDTTNTCANQSVARFDFTNGQPTIVYDTTATCTAEAAGGAEVEDYSVIWWE